MSNEFQKMNNTDHDLLIQMKTQLEYIIVEMQSLRDGTKKDIADLKIKVENNEKDILSNENNISDLEKEVIKLNKLHESLNTKSETNRAYILRKLFEWLLPLIVFIFALLLVKAGLISSDLIK